MLCTKPYQELLPISGIIIIGFSGTMHVQIVHTIGAAYTSPNLSAQVS